MQIETRTTILCQTSILIAFLHSHFGTVEFLSSEEVNEEIKKEEEEIKAKEEEEAKEEEKPETAITRENTQDADEDNKPQANGHDDVSMATKDGNRAETTGPVLRIRLDAHVADVTLEDMTVYSTHEGLKRRVESVLQVASRTITPLAPIHPKSSWVARGVTKRIAVKAEP
jgi:cleavage and polyadenylation specificity factor subunit 3